MQSIEEQHMQDLVLVVQESLADPLYVIEASPSLICLPQPEQDPQVCTVMDLM
jgi:hypothetical protein